MMRRASSTSLPLHVGAAYYPEHWPQERWPEDIRLMQEAGLTVVRLAEFSWSAMEPLAGEFHFDWLEQAIALLAEAGIVSVIGTPTAAPPAWLVQQHPDLLAVDESGRRVQFGNRCHYCVNSPEFHTAVRRLVSAMVSHLGSNPHVIGWQIDNEYNRVCYCERCQRLFQQFLKEKYGSLDALNQRWTTVYWSQTYSAWEQIPIPVGSHNPGLMLAFKHFVTHSYRKFQKMQVDLLRPHLPPGMWITHNFMGWYPGYDHYQMSEDLDLASWDWYIATGHHDYLNSGAQHDQTRGFKHKNFWLIETQPGNVNWATINNTLNKGEARAMAWHAVAHGADAVLYWQWRSAPGGQEQYHGTLIDQSGQPRPFYEEVRQIGQDFKKITALLAGSTIQSQVALLNDYDSRWSITWQPHHGHFDWVAHFNHYYRPLAAANLSTDVISADAPLDGYRLVIAPALAILGQERAERLKNFVRQGGNLVLTIRTGMKDHDNALLPLRQPGWLAEAAGAEVEDYYALLEPAPIHGDGLSGNSHLWAERLRVLDEANTQVLAWYGPFNGWLDGKPAITSHPYGAGQVYLIGAYLDEEAQRVLINRIWREAGARPVLDTPSGVEARLRLAPGSQPIFILINHDPDPKSIRLPWKGREYLNGKERVEELELAPYAVAILRRED